MRAGPPESPPEERLKAAAPNGASGEEALFRLVRSTGDAAARERLIQGYLPLARGLAARYRASSESFDDLIQVASLGLVKAVDRFDPEKGTSFEAYAAPTILGELKRHFRDRVLPIHIPRGVKERGQRIGAAIEALTGELDRSPTVAELARHTGLTEDETLEGLTANEATRTVSLDAPTGGEEGDRPAVIDGVGGRDPSLERADSALDVRGALSVLDDRERTCVRLRFGEDLTQEEIAGKVGVSQVHVSRILRGAVEKMRGAVSEKELPQSS